MLLPGFEVCCVKVTTVIDTDRDFHFSARFLGALVQSEQHTKAVAGNIREVCAVNDDLLDYCATRGVALVAYSPLLGGAYTRSDRSFREQYRGPDTDARLNALDSVAAELGATRNQVVLAWMRNSDPPVIPVVAASSGEQMEENMGALEIEPSADQMSRLDQASAGSG